MKLGKLLSFIILSSFLTACGGGGGGDSRTDSDVNNSSNGGGGSNNGGSGGSGSDSTPDEISFLDIENALPETLITSLPVIVTGIDTAVLVEVSEGEFSIDGQDFSSESRNIENNQTLVVRLISHVELGGVVSSDINVGDFMTTFNVTTKGDLSNPSVRIDFPVKDGVYLFDSELTVSGVAEDDNGIERIEVNGVQSDYDSESKKWHATIPLVEDGSTQIKVDAIDIYQNREEVSGVEVYTNKGYERLPRKGFAYSSSNGGELLFGSPLSRYNLGSKTFISVEVDDWIQSLEGFVYDQANDFVVGYINGSIYRLDNFSAESKQSELYSGELGEEIFDLVFDNSKSNIYFLKKDDGNYSLGKLELATNAVSVIKDDLLNGDRFQRVTALQWANDQLVFATNKSSSGESGAALFSLNIQDGTVVELTSFGRHVDFPIASIEDLIYRPLDDSFVFIGRPYRISNFVRSTYEEGEIYQWEVLSNSLTKVVGVNSLEPFNLNLSEAKVVEKGDSTNLLLTTESSDEIFEVNLTSGEVEQLTEPFRGVGPQLVAESVLEPLIYSSEEKKLYLTSSSAERDTAGKIISVDPQSGERSVITGPEKGTGPSFSFIYDLAFGSTGSLYALDGHRDEFSLIHVDIPSGNRTLISDNNSSDALVLTDAVEVEIDQVNERAWVISDLGRLTSISLETGEKTDLKDTLGQLTGSGSWVNIETMAMTKDGQYLYLLGYSSWSQPISREVYTVDVETGSIVMTSRFSDSSELTGSVDMILSADEETLIFVHSYAGDGLKSIPVNFSAPLKHTPLNSSHKLASIALDPDSGYLFGLDLNTNSILEINPESNMATAISY
ncbi:hypothetical protein [Microbulbifer sp. JMSA003]|uniref:hypothetical protein n=1 Tax=Microbulbifer sp. JMSA003 TaxID=3243369 RepID=UPI004039FBCF